MQAYEEEIERLNKVVADVKRQRDGAKSECRDLKKDTERYLKRITDLERTDAALQSKLQQHVRTENALALRIQTLSIAPPPQVQLSLAAQIIRDEIAENAPAIEREDPLDLFRQNDLSFYQPAANTTRQQSVLPLTTQFYDELFRGASPVPAPTTASNILNAKISTQTKNRQKAEERARSRSITLRWVAQANLMSFLVPKWRSSFSFGAQQAIYDSYTTSSAALITENILPGTFSLNYQHTIVEDLAKSRLIVDPVEERDDVFVIGSHDNAQHQKFHKKRDAGLGAGKQTIPVMTARVLFSILCPKLAKLQTEWEHHPEMMRRNFPHSLVPHDAMLPSTTPDPSNPDRDISEGDYLQYAWEHDLYNAFHKVVTEDTWKSEKRGEALAQSVDERERESAEKGEETKGNNKKCTYCDFYCPNRNRICNFCSSPLPVMAQVKAEEGRRERNGNGAASNGNSKKQRQDSSRREFDCCDGVARRSDLVVKEDDDVEQVKRGQGFLEVNGIRTEYRTLPMLPHNPGCHWVQRMILERNRHVANVGITRHSFAEVADAGGFPVHDIIDGSKSGDKDVLFIVGLGHAEQSLLRLGTSTTAAVVGSACAKAHSFETETATNYLHSGKETHYSYRYLSIVRCALQEELVKQYLLAKDSLNCLDSSSFSNFMVWINDSQEDVQFENIVEYAQLLTHISLFRKALRDPVKQGKGNGFALDAVIKYVLPLKMERGFTTYTLLLAWDQARYYRVTPEVKAALKNDLRVFNFEGVDYFQEADIHRMKLWSSSGKNRGTAWDLRKASVLHESSKSGANALKIGLGMTNNNVGLKRNRSETDPTDDASAFGMVFRKFDESFKKVPGRKCGVKSIDGVREWIPGVSLKGLRKSGEEKLEEAIRAQFKYVVPRATKLTTDELDADTPIDSFRIEGDDEQELDLD